MVQQRSVSERGLTGTEARARLAADGPNEIAAQKPHGPWALALEVVREPMFLLLIACAALYLLMGDAHDAIMLLSFVVVVIGITFIQQRRTERALDALRDLSSPRALVIRDGAPKRIAGREVVRGDLLVLAEGDRVPADSVLVSGLNVSVDESLLTGESVPVRKSATHEAQITMAAPGGEDTPYLFSGTLVVQGKGTALVLKTGPRTALGGIGAALTQIQEEPTRIQRETSRVVKRLAIGGVALSLLIAVIYAATRADLLNGLLAGITTAMAILPEELPVILTIFLGLGAWRIAKKNVLTRRVPAIEMLGAATVLCTDKTGTLTQNRMQVRELAVDGAALNIDALGDDALPEAFHELLEFATLAGHRDPVDPMERAIASASSSRLAKTEHLHADWELVNEYPLSRELQAMSRVWASRQGGRYVIAVKGAPEAVTDLCHLDAAALATVREAADSMASRGLRVLGVGRAYFSGAALPEIQHDFEFAFVGLIGLVDPLRDDVPAAIREAQAAGIRVVMITGDYAVTAMSIASQAGIDTRGGCLSGTELGELDEAQLLERVRTVNVYCRTAPEQKLRLVDAVKASGEIVAMTGDGVNDAPALKAAHIGIAMGERGTDVAREAAALVLLDDSFSSIVEAVRQGRRIFDNLRNAVTFVVAVHVPIVGMSFLPVVFGWPLLLMPVHVMFLQLVIDPVCSVVFEAEREDEGTMRRPPRPSTASLFGARSVSIGIAQGVALLTGVMAVQLLAWNQGLQADSVRASTFLTVVLGILVLIFANRSPRGLRDTLRRANHALWGIVIGASALLGLVLALPTLRSPFHFGPVRSGDIVVSIVAVLLCGLFFEMVKRALHKRLD